MQMLDKKGDVERPMVEKANVVAEPQASTETPF
jgi:hypothetical protein